MIQNEVTKADSYLTYANSKPSQNLSSYSCCCQASRLSEHVASPPADMDASKSVFTPHCDLVDQFKEIYIYIYLYKEAKAYNGATTK